MGQAPLFMDDREGYRGPAVAKIVGISYRQLDHWTTKGIVTPSVQTADGSGTQRLYSFDDIVRLRMIKRLRDAGASLQKITKVLEALADRGQSLGDVTLMTDGSNVFVCDDQAQVMDVLMSGQGVFGIALAPLRDAVQADVVGIPTERAHAGVVPTHGWQRRAV